MFRYITRIDYREFKIFVKSDFIMSNNRYIREAMDHCKKNVMPYIDTNKRHIHTVYADEPDTSFLYITFETLDHANWFMLKFADVITTEGYNFE